MGFMILKLWVFCLASLLLCWVIIVATFHGTYANLLHNPNCDKFATIWPFYTKASDLYWSKMQTEKWTQLWPSHNYDNPGSSYCIKRCFYLHGSQLCNYFRISYIINKNCSIPLVSYFCEIFANFLPSSLILNDKRIHNHHES